MDVRSVDAGHLAAKRVELDKPQPVKKAERPNDQRDKKQSNEDDPEAQTEVDQSADSMSAVLRTADDGEHHILDVRV